jgi:hypothetical protein
VGRRPVEIGNFGQKIELDSGSVGKDITMLLVGGGWFNSQKTGKASGNYMTPLPGKSPGYRCGQGICYQRVAITAQAKPGTMN